MRLLVFILLLILTSFHFHASAQELDLDNNAEENVKEDGKDAGPKKKVISFEDQLVEGETKTPDLFYLLEKRQFDYKRLIKLRENFLPEMNETAEDLQTEGATD